MRMRTVLPAAIAATALVLAGCSGGGSGDDSTGSANAFDFWSFTGINQKSDVEAYMAAHPDITVNLTEVGSSTETAQALTTALAGGKVPDLVLIQGDDLPNFVQNPGNFVDLTTLGADDIADDYLDWTWNNATALDGSVIGVPTDVGGLAMAYRTDLFEAAGLPTDPDEVAALWSTWDDFIDVGEQYVATTGKKFIDNVSTSIFYQTVNQGDEKYYSSDGELVYDSNPQVESAFQTALDASTAGISANLASFAEGWTTGMANGDFATIATPSWMMSTIKTNAPDTSGTWAITTIPGGAGNWGGSYLAIPAGAAHPELAWEYIKEMQSPQAQLTHFTENGTLPATPSVYDSEEMTSFRDEFFGDSAVGVTYTDSVLNMKPFFIGPNSAAIGNEFLQVLVSVEAGSVAPGDAWDTALANVKTAIGG